MREQSHGVRSGDTVLGGAGDTRPRCREDLLHGTVRLGLRVRTRGVGLLHDAAPARRDRRRHDDAGRAGARAGCPTDVADLRQRRQCRRHRGEGRRPRRHGGRRAVRRPRRRSHGGVPRSRAGARRGVAAPAARRRGHRRRSRCVLLERAHDERRPGRQEVLRRAVRLGGGRQARLHRVEGRRPRRRRDAADHPGDGRGAAVLDDVLRRRRLRRDGRDRDGPRWRGARRSSRHPRRRTIRRRAPTRREPCSR